MMPETMSEEEAADYLRTVLDACDFNELDKTEMMRGLMILMMNGMTPSASSLLLLHESRIRLIEKSLMRLEERLTQ